MNIDVAGPAAATSWAQAPMVPIANSSIDRAITREIKQILFKKLIMKNC
jgi:hypothetical protein